MKKFLLILPFMVFLFFVGCSKSPSDVAGGFVTDVGNAFVSGRIVTASGLGAPNAQVALLPASFDPVMQNAAPILLDTTDASGSYAFADVQAGSYNIEALDPASATKALHSLLVSQGDTLNRPADTLRITGTLRIVLHKPVDTLNGYFYLPGTYSFVRFTGNIADSGFVLLDSVPAALLPPLLYAQAGLAAPPRKAADAAAVLPGATAAADWGASLGVERATTPPVIDGVLGEFSTCVPVIITDSTDGTRADVRLLWDDSALYIGVRVMDKRLYYFEPFAGEDLVSQDDGIELMMNKSNNRTFWMGLDDYKYYINVAGRRVDERAGDSSWDASWQATVSYQGSLNDNGDIDTGYTVEFALPWANLNAGAALAGGKVAFDIVLNNGYGYEAWHQIPWANHRDIPDYLWINIPEEWGELLLK